MLCGTVAVGLICGAAKAKTVHFPVSIPHACVPLAHREGFPTVIKNRYQAVRAMYKLYHMKKSDPLVRHCRSAVKRLERRLKERTKLERVEIAQVG